MASFYGRIYGRNTTGHTGLITAKDFQLGGECLASQTEYMLEGQCWESDLLASPDESLRDFLVEFIV
jgi:hypothetical protein